MTWFLVFVQIEIAIIGFGMAALIFLFLDLSKAIDHKQKDTNPFDNPYEAERRRRGKL